MSRSKLYNMIKSRGTSENGRNAHDLTSIETLTENVATITPIKVIDTIPDDYFQIDIRNFTQQLSAMNTAALVRGRKEIAAYFLPYNSIWSNYNQYQSTREDPESSLLQQQGISYEPRIAIFSLYQTALEFFCEYIYCHYFVNMSRFEAWLHAYEDAHGDHAPIDVALEAFESERIRLERETLSSTVETFALEFFALDNKLVSSDPAFGFYDDPSTGLTRRHFALNSVGNYCWCDVLRKLDNLGYSNVYPYFKKALDEIEFYDTAWKSLASDGVISEDTFTTWYNQVYLNALYIGSSGSSILRTLLYRIQEISSSYDSGGNMQHVFVNVYPLFAYNRCFYDMFRNSYFDLDYSSRNYNCDFLNCKTLAGSILWPRDLTPRFWHLEHHQYKKDMFTGVLPDVQFGVVSSLSLSSVSIVNDSVPSSSGSASVSSLGYLYSPLSSQPRSNWTIPSAFNVMELKRAEALQQYRIDLMRAGNRTQDIFKQIYGTHPKSQLDSSPYFIEVAGQDLYVDPVISTAATGQQENGALGDISARLTVQMNNKFKFSTHDFGLIMILSYSLVDTSYNSYRINPHRMNLTPEEHFIPQLMNLGFEPVTNEMLNSLGDFDFRKQIRGYVPPYIEFKTDVDQLHGNLVDLPVAVSTPYQPELLQNEGDFYFGSLSIWGVSRTYMQSQYATQLNQFYQNPNVMDSVFMVRHGVDYETDHFISHYNIIVNAVRQLSELGLPRFC